MLGKFKGKIINWLLKGVHLQELHIGEHSVVVSGTGINMGATKVENVAAPDSDDDAPRRDTIDSKITTHKGDASAHHAKTVIADLSPIALADLAAAVCSETEAKSFVTKEFFVPVFGGTTIERKGALLTLAGNEAFVSLIFPQDFIAITDIELIFLPNETGANMHISITTYYSSKNGGENEDVHTEMGPNRDIGATVNNQNLAHSISDLVDIAAPVAGDLLNVIAQFSLTAIDSNAFLRGIRLKYT